MIFDGPSAGVKAFRLSCEITAPVTTPFRNDRVDLDALQYNIGLLNGTPLTGYVVLGSTGEAPLLSEEERLNIVNSVVAAAEPSKRIYVGISGESLLQAERSLDKVSRWPVHGYLSLHPSYYKNIVDRKLLYDFYSELSEHAPAPILIYNVPQFTGMEIPTEVLHDLADLPNVSGWKDSSSDLTRFAEVCRSLDEKQFECYIGNADAFNDALRAGAAGGILALANLAPELCAAVAAAHAAGDSQAAEQHQEGLSRLNSGIFQPFGIAGLKYALDVVGYTGGEVRLPYRQLTPSERATVQEVVESVLLFGPVSA